MALPTILLTLLALLLIPFTISWIATYRRLSHIPGPPLCGLSILPWLLIHTKRDAMERSYSLSKKYGPLVRVAPNTIITSDADSLRKISAPRSPYRRSMFYYAMRLNPGKDHIFSTMDESEHDDLRKKMAAGYSGKENLALEREIDSSILELCELIDEKYISQPGEIRPMDLARKITFLTLDIISKAAFDHKFNDLRDDGDNYGYIAEVEALLPNLTWTAVLPEFPKFLTDIGLLQWLAGKADGSAGVEKIKKVAAEQVAKRFDADGAPKQDMLDSFIRRGLTQERAKEEAVLNLTAGTDTSATTMRVVLLNVITSPRLYQALVAEIDEGIANGIVPRAEGEVIAEEQAKRLPLLQATIKEGLRWFPAVAAEMSKVTPPEGDTICGYFVPGGTKVGSSMMAIHRNPELFGPDPDAFRPGRWLPATTMRNVVTMEGPIMGAWTPPPPHPMGDESDGAKLYAMNRNNELAFGGGRFQCLGKPVAWMELNKVFVELLRRFEFQLMDPLKPWDSRCCGTHLQKDMWVTVRRRTRVTAETTTLSE